MALDPLKVFAALVAPVRWYMIQRLAAGKEMSASEFKAALGGTLENICRHLRALNAAGMVSSKPGADRRSPMYSIPAAFRQQQNEVDFGCCIVRIPGANAALGGKD